VESPDLMNCRLTNLTSLSPRGLIQMTLTKAFLFMKNMMIEEFELIEGMDHEMWMIPFNRGFD
jgi:hypothetical protein